MWMFYIKFKIDSYIAKTLAGSCHKGSDDIFVLSIFGEFYLGYCLEQRQHKNDSVDWKNIFVLKLARFFARVFGEKKQAANSQQRIFSVHWVDLILS